MIITRVNLLEEHYAVECPYTFDFLFFFQFIKVGEYSSVRWTQILDYKQFSIFMGTGNRKFFAIV